MKYDIMSRDIMPYLCCNLHILGVAIKDNGIDALLSDKMMQTSFQAHSMQSISVRAWTAARIGFPVSTCIVASIAAITKKQYSSSHLGFVLLARKQSIRITSK